MALPHSAVRRIILSSHNLCLKFYTVNFTVQLVPTCCACRQASRHLSGYAFQTLRLTAPFTVAGSLIQLLALEPCSWLGRYAKPPAGGYPTGLHDPSTVSSSLLVHPRRAQCHMTPSVRASRTFHAGEGGKVLTLRSCFCFGISQASQPYRQVSFLKLLGLLCN